ncbi:NAD(P)-binding domain-containing protein [Salisaeta longa]|uniref:NAD(P)-binding domain-containing protein n=1 Tax=Salisaeta longa TaxID=503170 RepID=UPI0004097799|nr:NAD(P)-binding domain-containing protein [Salisaeta longa]
MLSALRSYAHWLHLQWPGGTVEQLPRTDAHHQTNVDGVYVVGDLSGVPLLKFSLDSGVQAVRHLVAHSNRLGRGPDDHVDVVILGAGASGMAAAREAQQQGLSVRVLEAQRRFATIKDFQAGKPIYTYPADMTPAGDVQVTADVKEALVDELEAQTQDISVTAAEAHRIRDAGNHLVVETTDGAAIEARHVIVGIGRSGNFRTLDVPGEDQDHVHHRLHDPSAHAGEDVVVVGGGDSAAEAAIALTEAGAHVRLSYRRGTFGRPKEENVERLYELASYHAGEGTLELILNSEVRRIEKDRVVLETPDDTETVPAQHVYATIGREAPIDFFRRSGIALRNDWGDPPDSWRAAVSSLDWVTDLRWDRIGAMTAFVLFMAAVYSWTKSGWLHRLAQEAGAFPFSITPPADPASLAGVVLTSMQQPSFYYTLAYSAIVVIFGFRRIRRRKTPYVKVQTLTLMAIQVVPLFLLPEVILPYLGHNGLLPTGVLDALFPVTEYAVHGREYWRAYGFILAWPLSVYNVFTAEPLWWWIGICFVQTFVLIPALIYYWGKGAYCGWICSCGALAETLGDTHRDKMPHGEGWNKLNLAGQALLALAFALLFLRIGGWIWPGSWMEAVYAQVFYGTVAGLKLNYSWLVDVVLAGMIGYGVYFWLSGRFWCRFFCPLAALMHIYARFSRFRILADKKKCISCNVCTSVCHQGIDVMHYAQQGAPMEDPECVRCSACVQSCPTGVLSFGQVEPSTGQVITVDELEASYTRIQEEAAA